MLTRVEAKVANVHHIIPGRIISLSSVVITPYHLILFEMVMSLLCVHGAKAVGLAVEALSRVRPQYQSQNPSLCIGKNLENMKD